MSTLERSPNHPYTFYSGSYDWHEWESWLQAILNSLSQDFPPHQCIALKIFNVVLGCPAARFWRAISQVCRKFLDIESSGVVHLGLSLFVSHFYRVSFLFWFSLAASLFLCCLNIRDIHLFSSGLWSYTSCDVRNVPTGVDSAIC